MEQQADGSATGKTKQPEPKQAEAKPTEVKEAQSKQADAKQAYARAMPQCEQWMDFAPLATVFRTTD